MAAMTTTSLGSGALSGEAEVYTKQGFLHRKGRWVGVTATLEKSRLRLVSDDLKYDKVCYITAETRLEGATERPWCVWLVHFNGSKKARRLLDFRTEAALARWSEALRNAAERKESVTSVLTPTEEPPATTVLRPSSPVRVKSFRRDKKARERLLRAIAGARSEVVEKRRKQKGYSAFELATLRVELDDLRKEARRALRFKIRRVLRALKEQQQKQEEGERKLTAAVVERAERHGLLLSSSSSGRGNRPYSPRHHHHHHHPGAAALEGDHSSILQSLPALLQRNKVLPYLAQTLTYLAARSPLTLQDAVTCLLAGTVMETLLNLPGGLSVLLSLRRERFAFKRLCVAALMCQVPLFTSRVVDMLAALAVLPEKDAHVEGSRLVRSVLADLDTKYAQHWGESVCLRDEPLRPSREARSNSAPPSYAALAQIVLNRDASPELRTAVMSLFTALCASVHRSQSRDNALWLQVQIFYALRVVDDGRPFHSAEEAFAMNSASSGTVRRATTTTVRRRRASEKKKKEAPKAAPSSSLCAPLVAVLADAARCEAEATDPDDRKKAGLLRISVERFLDGWDARELDEEEDLATLDRLPGSSLRAEILASRIRRAALLLAHHDVDSLLEKLGEELEVAAATQVNRDNRDDDSPLDLDVRATSTALGRVSREQQQHDLHSTASATRPVAVAAAAVAFVSSSSSSSKKKENLTTTKEDDDDEAFSSLPSLKDHPVYGKYLKMLRLHIPKPAVALKMSAEGLDPAILDRDPNEPLEEEEEQQRPSEKTRPLVREDPRYAKYFRMLRMHVPMDAVKQKMAQEGHDPSILERGDDAAASSPPEQKEEQKKEPAVPLKDDPTYGKYVKMVKMHVPRMAVEAKMAAEGLDPDVLKGDPEKPAAAPLRRKEEETKPSKSVFGALLGPSKEQTEKPPFCARAPKDKIRRLFLDLLTDGDRTLYEEQKKKKKKDQEHPEVLNCESLDEFESVFQMPNRRTTLASEDAAAAARAAATDMAEIEQTTSTKKNAKLKSIAAEALGPKRAFGLNLMLGSLKASTEAVAAALDSLDPEEATLRGGKHLARLSVVYNILADDAEIQTIDRRIDDLSSASSSGASSKLDEISRFFVGLRGVPRKRAKVVTLWFASTVDERVAELHQTIGAYRRVASLLLAATELHKLLMFTFALSNFANFGTARANVAGVKVSSLLKLGTTKTTVQTTFKNLLTFAAKHADVDPADLRDQLPADALAAVYLSSPRTEVKNLIRALKAELDVVTVEATHADAAKAIVQDASPKLVALDETFDVAETELDDALAFFGEPPTTDLEAWLRAVDRFVTQYEEESFDLNEATERTKRRQQLEDKKQKRCEDLVGFSEDAQPTLAAKRSVSFASSQDDKGHKKKPSGALQAALHRVNSGRALEVEQLPDLRTFADTQIAKLRSSHRSDFDDDDDQDDDDDFLD